jgi:membrane-bound lytic murein transglycosylase B
VAAPANAGLEKGFGAWVLDLHRMAKQIGVSQVVYADEETQRQMQAVLARTPVSVERTFRTVHHWTRDVGLIGEVTPDDLLVVVSARAATLSHDNALDKIPRQLARKFEKVSFVILYPEQKVVE